jgi:hypothetical protein
LTGRSILCSHLHPSGSVPPSFIAELCQKAISIFDYAIPQEEDAAHIIHHPKEQKAPNQLHYYLKDPLIKSLAQIPINLEIFCSQAAKGNLPDPQSTMTGVYIELINWLGRRYRIDRQKDNLKDVLETHNPLRPFNSMLEDLEKTAWRAMQQDTLYLNVEIIEELIFFTGPRFFPFSEATPTNTNTKTKTKMQKKIGTP